MTRLSWVEPGGSPASGFLHQVGCVLDVQANARPRPRLLRREASDSPRLRGNHKSRQRGVRVLVAVPQRVQDRRDPLLDVRGVEASVPAQPYPLGVADARSLPRLLVGEGENGVEVEAALLVHAAVQCRVFLSPVSMGVPVNPMNDAFGRPSRRFRARPPMKSYWLRCASSADGVLALGQDRKGPPRVPVVLGQPELLQRREHSSVTPTFADCLVSLLAPALPCFYRERTLLKHAAERSTRTARLTRNFLSSVVTIHRNFCGVPTPDDLQRLGG